MALTTVAGSEARVNTTTALNQADASVAQLTDGSYVVSWTGNTSASASEVYAQRFTAGGTKIGGQITVTTLKTGLAKDSDVAPLASGGFVVGWNHELPSGTKFSTHAQRFNATGGKLGADTLVSANATYQQNVTQMGEWNGGYLTVWESNNAQPPTANGYGIHAVTADSAGVVNKQDLRVNLTLLKDQLDPSLAMFAKSGSASTGFVVAFETPDSSGYGIVGRTFNGTPLGGPAEFQVNTTQTGEQRDPAAAVLTNGDIVISWTSTGQDGSGAGVYAQRFTKAGVKIGAETRINTTTANDQGHSQVTGLADGGYVIVWDSVNQDGSGSGIYLQRYDAAGAKIGGETLVNSFTTGDQYDPAVSALGAGFVVTWTSRGQDGSGDGVYQKVFTTTSTGQTVTTTILTANADTFTGVAGQDSINGGLGNDRIDGADGADTVSGFDGNDIAKGGLGNDLVLGGAGDDWLAGGQGADSLTGGLGLDSFRGTAGMGVDRVTDFNLAQGDRIALDQGLTYTLRYSGADTIVDLGGGDQLLIAGVKVTAPAASWIVYV